MRNVQSSRRVTDKSTLSRALRLVDEYVEYRAFVRAWPSLVSTDDAGHQFAELRAEMDGPVDNGFDQAHGGSDEIP